MTAARAQLLAAVSEKEWMGYVTSLAAIRGWDSYHTFDSRHSPAGFPDCVFVRGGRLVFAELKSEKGKATVTQQRWLDQLSNIAAAAGGAVEVYLWRPSDRDQVEAVLS